MLKDERTVIEKSIHTTSQATACTYIYKKQNHTLKLEIYADDVDFQSYAKAWLFSETKWNLIYEIPYSLMKTNKELAFTDIFLRNKNKNLATDKNVWNYYKADLDELQLKLESIVF